MTGMVLSQDGRTCCDVPDFLDPTVVDRCASSVMDNKDSPMDMAYGWTQEDALFSPGLRVIIMSKHIRTIENHISAP